MSGASPRRVSPVLLGLAGVALVIVFASLGTWQVHRRAWKLDLIARVERRIHAPPQPLPPVQQWSEVTADRDEYRRVEVRGTYIHNHDTLVHALSEAGAGSWVMTPLRTAAGAIILINRGFLPLDSTVAPPAAGETTLTGLLRLSEPGGVILRRNDPADDSWYGRDTAAIAAARGLGPVAPFFIDADAVPARGPGVPQGGLTVVDFPNNHLSYAITWYVLALMTAGVLFWFGYARWMPLAGRGLGEARSSTKETDQIRRPPSASKAPTHPVDDQP